MKAEEKVKTKKVNHSKRLKNKIHGLQNNILQDKI